MLNHVTATKKSDPCAGCGNASETEVWGIRVCYPCHALWISDERFSSGVINAALGISNKPEDFTKANHERYCVEATKRTKAWLLERSKRAA